MKQKINWDAMGIGTSLLCAVHCAVLPLLFSSLPLFGINVIHNKPFEWFMIGLAFLIGIISLLSGYRKHHRSLIPSILFSIGIFCLALRMFIPSLEVLLLIPAVGFIVGAHYYNYRLCAMCAH